MTITALTGPFVTFRDGAVGPNPGTNENPETGPSVFDQGTMLLDPRAPFTYAPGNAPGSPCRGFLNAETITIDATPSAATVVSIVALVNGSGATSLTLATTSTLGVTPGASVVNALTGATVTGVLAIEGTAGAVSFGQSGSVQAWDPTKALSRNITATAIGGDNSGATITVSGYDIYGYPMTELIAGSTSGVSVLGKKAFKYVSGVAVTGIASGIELGHGTLVGFPLKVSNVGHVSIYGQTTGSWMSTTSTITAAVTSTATTTTGDVRGTVSTLGTGTAAMVVYQSVSVANISTTTGLFGVTQA